MVPYILLRWHGGWLLIWLHLFNGSSHDRTYQGQSRPQEFTSSSHHWQRRIADLHSQLWIISRKPSAWPPWLCVKLNAKPIPSWHYIILRHYFKLGLRSTENAQRNLELKENETISDSGSQNWFKHFTDGDLHIEIMFGGEGAWIINYDALKRKMVGRVRVITNALKFSDHWNIHYTTQEKASEWTIIIKFSMKSEGRKKRKKLTVVKN